MELSLLDTPEADGDLGMCNLSYQFGVLDSRTFQCVLYKSYSLSPSQLLCDLNGFRYFAE